MDLTTALLTATTAVAAGLNSGAFFAFSNFAMPALAGLPPADGARAMQAINITAPSPGFMTALMGGAVTGLALTVTNWGTPTLEARWLVAGGLLSAASAVITIGFHVPRNNRLAVVDPDSAEGQAYWRGYLRSWTRGNHVRTATSAASVAALVVGAIAGSAG